MRSTAARIIRGLAVVSAAMPFVAGACSGPVPKPFQQLLADSTSIVIVRVESERITERSIDPLFAPEVVANVRTVEVLQGSAGSLKSITYLAAACGGHRLHVGSYYVAIRSSDDEAITLSFDDSSVLGLGAEYSEEEKSANSRSFLLMNLRNFKRLRQFPETFNLEPFIALARYPVEWPSTSPRRLPASHEPARDAGTITKSEPTKR